MTEFVLPPHTNAFGTVFGGQIMAWVDLCASICAQRHAGHTCVTASLDDLSFRRPVRVGQVILFHARVTATFRTSMEIEVTVEGEDTLTGERWPTVDCRTTFVAVLSDGTPTEVPRLILENDEQRASQAEAEERRRVRLLRRQSERDSQEGRKGGRREGA
jgi:acyl-CoA hydrolase